MTEIFVFGSNLGGYHGAGSALHALENHGAIYGLGVGLAGNSYALPTKDSNIECLELDTIRLYVNQFIEFAESRQDLTFNVVAIGCGLAGFSPHEIAPMFAFAPNNVNLPPEFTQALADAQSLLPEMMGT